MVKEFNYKWSEAEDDNLDELLKEAHERNKDRTIAEIDAEWNDFVKSLKLETAYSAHETVKRDNFIDPYIGKCYKDAAEVFTMGLEGLFTSSKFTKGLENHHPIIKK
ncbi:hypothetical protein [Streptococcus sp. DD12]|uniref:hypothetical protein n=1 Tax=Streptococcus sp. DD12 TaxID=1777880 RepID=UPI0007991F6C|nr:hypothetical protein [Streptococcus sp. DD12]KXT76716.1 hypothetical protein STRDD12_00354 [Streptococcus sp. DD12]